MIFPKPETQSLGTPNKIDAIFKFQKFDITEVKEIAVL